MVYGELLNDGGYLILSSEEKNKLIRANPEYTRFIKKLVGAKEFIRGEERWCFYLYGDDKKWKEFKELDNLLKKVTNHRFNSTEKRKKKIA